jgi:hypothetical protein
MAVKKTTLVVPIDVPGVEDFIIPVTIEGYTESAVQVHRYCVKAHDPERVRQTTACPKCANADYKSFVRGVESGGQVALLEPAEEVEVEVVKKDHSRAIITAHPRDTFMEQALVQGAVYRVAPQPGQETVFLSLMEAIEKNPDRAYVTTWGWTDKVTKIWLLGVNLGNLVFMEAQHPSNVRQLAAPVGTSNKNMVEAFSELIDEDDFVVDNYEDHAAVAKAALAKLGVEKKAKVEVQVDPEAQLMAALAAKRAKAKAKAKKVA